MYHDSEHLGRGAEQLEETARIHIRGCERRIGVGVFGGDYGQCWVDKWIWEASVYMTPKSVF